MRIFSMYFALFIVQHQHKKQSVPTVDVAVSTISFAYKINQTVGT